LARLPDTLTAEKMTKAEWIMVAAVLAAPVLAVQVQKYLDILREKRGRRMWIFQSLMATRAARVSAQHVHALNMIDIEFYGRRVFGVRFQSKSEKQIVEAWKTYLDQLNTQCGDAEGEFHVWVKRGEDLLVELLYAMAQCLGYDFDKVTLRRGCYSPRGHAEDELMQRFIRDNWAKVVSGRQPLQMQITLSKEQLAAQNAPNESQQPAGKI
jgi:hypothetical protein